MSDPLMQFTIGVVRCWICLGAGVVVGPLYSEPCPNPNCPHRGPLEIRRYQSTTS